MKTTTETYRTVTPYLCVPNADSELDFLQSALGGKVTMCDRRPDNTVMHAQVEIGDSLVMVGQAGDQWKPLAAAIYLWVEDVDGTYQKALEAGATSESAPEDKPYGHRSAGVVDRNNVTWWIASPVR